MRFLNLSAKWLFVLCLPIFLLTASIAGAFNSLWLYRYGFDKYNVSAATGLAPAELEKAARGLIRYFNSSEAEISVTIVKGGQPFTLFNEREVAHLRDVKDLFRRDYLVLLGTAVYLLGYAVVSLRQRKKRPLAQGVLAGSLLTLVLMLLAGLGALLDFDRLFVQFHLLSFANDFWMLDPTRDYLIMLFPGGFWYDTALVCILFTLAGAVVLGGVSGLYLTRRSRNDTA